MKISTEYITDLRLVIVDEVSVRYGDDMEVDMVVDKMIDMVVNMEVHKAVNISVDMDEKV